MRILVPARWTQEETRRYIKHRFGVEPFRVKYPILKIGDIPRIDVVEVPSWWQHEWHSIWWHPKRWVRTQIIWKVRKFFKWGAGYKRKTF